MPFKFGSGGGGSRKLIEEGMHKAILFRVCHVGMQNSTYNGEPRQRDTLYWSFELVGTKVSDEIPEPKAYHETLTNSLHENARMTQHLKDWFGPVTPSQMASLDPRKLLGMPCILHIKHEKSEYTDRVSDKIRMIQKVDSGPVTPQNPMVFYSVEEHDKEAYGKLPDWLKRQVVVGLEKLGINSSDMANEIQGGGTEENVYGNLFGDTPAQEGQPQQSQDNPFGGYTPPGDAGDNEEDMPF